MRCLEVLRLEQNSELFLKPQIPFIQSHFRLGAKYLFLCWYRGFPISENSGIQRPARPSHP